MLCICRCVSISFGLCEVRNSLNSNACMKTYVRKYCTCVRLRNFEFHTHHYYVFGIWNAFIELVWREEGMGYEFSLPILALYCVRGVLTLKGYIHTCYCSLCSIPLPGIQSSEPLPCM